MHRQPEGSVKIKIGDQVVEESAQGDGPVDAVFKAIRSITKTQSKLLKYEVKAITGGTDAQGEVVCSLEEDNMAVSGHGADTDVITASAKAYINAINKLEARKSRLL
jgi:2-isopropylmalate synthase